MQYGDPTLSSGWKSGNTRRKSCRRPGLRFAIAIPAGLRSQTPISHTASKPNAAIASHSWGGTEPSSMKFPYFLLRSASQTQVLISYTLGNRGHLDIVLPQHTDWKSRDRFPVVTSGLIYVDTRLP